MSKIKTGPEKSSNIIAFPATKRPIQAETKAIKSVREKLLLKQFVEVFQMQNKQDRAKQFCKIKTAIFDYVYLEMDQI